MSPEPHIRTLIIDGADISASADQTILEAAREPADFRAQITGHGEQCFVGWFFNQDFIIWFDERRHGEMVRHRSTLRVNNTIRWNFRLFCQPFDERGIAVAVAGVCDFELLDSNGQILQRIGEHIAAGKFVAGRGTQLRPLDIGRPDFTPLGAHQSRLEPIECRARPRKK